jgi:putative tryptophan/tyrosine transport system substrate-binding protein
VRRRALFLGLGAAALLLGGAAAQAAKLPSVVILFGGSAALFKNGSQPFFVGLSEQGYRDGQNVAIKVRTAEGRYSELSSLMADLLADKPDVIAALASRAAVAAKAATSTIPVVIGIAADPVALGLVASLGRPGGNVTGTTFLSIELQAKQLELLHELIPGAATVGFLINPDAPDAAAQTARAQAAARALGLTLVVVEARGEGDFDAALGALGDQHAGALLVGGDEFLMSASAQIAALAGRRSLPAIGPLRVFPFAGGLASYGASLAEALHQAGSYVGRILNGAKPADLPFVEAAKFDLVINLKTAKALGLTVPQSLLQRADEVIE